jgi:phosphoserine phosphatase RsbU/P
MADSGHVLQCMEIVGDNRAGRRMVVAPGLDIWIDSRPLGHGAGGGDVHYISSCGGGYVTRLALADVAGHGESANGFAVILRQLMRKYINTLDQTRFAMALNRELTASPKFGPFATALLVTYFAPTRHLIICNAGHGRPLRYSARYGKWDSLDLKRAGACPSLKASRARYHLERLANLPLGVVEPIEYQQFAVEFDDGDMVLLCTDGITESADEAGHLLAEAGLLTLVNKLGPSGVAGFGERLLDAIELRRGRSVVADDQTLIVIQRNQTQPPRPSLLRTARTLVKLIGLSRD